MPSKEAEEVLFRLNYANRLDSQWTNYWTTRNNPNYANQLSINADDTFRPYQVTIRLGAKIVTQAGAETVVSFNDSEGLFDKLFKEELLAQMDTIIRNVVKAVNDEAKSKKAQALTELQAIEDELNNIPT